MTTVNLNGIQFRNDWQAILSKILRDTLGLTVEASHLRLLKAFAVTKASALYILHIKGNRPRFINLKNALGILQQVAEVRSTSTITKSRFMSMRVSEVLPTDWLGEAVQNMRKHGDYQSYDPILLMSLAQKGSQSPIFKMRVSQLKTQLPLAYEQNIRAYHKGKVSRQIVFVANALFIRLQFWLETFSEEHNLGMESEIEKWIKF